MKTASAKAKGRRLQDWVRDRLKYFFHFEDKDIRCALMGEKGADLKLISDKAKEEFPFYVECKNQEKFKTLYNFYDQAVKGKDKDTEPLLFIKMNNREPLAIMDAEEFINLMSYHNELLGK